MVNKQQINVCPATEESCREAAALLAAGKLVVFPTETVYGLGADAESTDAVQAIYDVKVRPSHNPLIVHVNGVAMAERYAVFNDSARLLAKRFWPGALTLVLPAKNNSHISELVSAKMATIAIRCPGNHLALDIIGCFGRGVAAPSANRSGRISPTSAAHVLEEFPADDERIGMIIDGGPTAKGVESTIIDCTGVKPTMLRHGTLTADDIQSATGVTLDAAVTGEIKAPGMLASHYAPTTKVRLLAERQEDGEALLGFGEAMAGAVTDADHALNLSPSGDLAEAAYHLYDYLRRLDAMGCERIAVMSIPERGIGVAINDRLRRAAAPK